MLHKQRHLVTLLRWTMFLSLAYLSWVSGGGATAIQLALLLVVAASNVGLGRLSAAAWEHHALLPTLALFDIGVLSVALLVGTGFAADLFFAYFVLLALVALTPTLRWAMAATALVVTGYGLLMALQNGAAFFQTPELAGRLGFLLSVGVVYGGLAETAGARLRESAIQGQLVGWVGKLSGAFSDDFDAFDVIRQILLDLQNQYPVAARASVVQINDGHVMVIGSSDNADVREFALDLDKYPEIVRAIDRQEPLLIDDLRSDPALEAVRELVADLKLSSLLLCPVNLNDANMGHIVLRVARKQGQFTPSAVRTMSAVAEAIAVIFRQAKMRETLERSERVEMVSQITTSVSHSFDGILSTILLSAQGLRESASAHRHVAACDAPPCDAASIEKFGSIELAVKEGMAIVERLAAWTRVDRQSGNSLGSNQSVIDPAALLDEAWHYARPYWLRREASREMELHLDIQPARNVKGNHAELREILLNLMVNAIDAMPRGGDMTLSLSEVDGRVRFAVQDTGIGIAQEDLPRVFEPLYSTKGAAGTGLGLTIAKSVAERHSGEITATSSLGSGSVFEVWLPAVDEQVTETAAESAEATGTVQEGKRVLLVESNQLVRDVMERFLHTSGLEVDIVDTLKEAEVMIGTARHYVGILADARGGRDSAREFLDHLVAGGFPDMARRLLFYSTGPLPEELQLLAQRYGCGSIDRSAGLRALTEELERQFDWPEPGERAA